MSDRKTDLRKSLKSLYDDLCDAENGPDRNTFGFKHRLKVIHENIQDLEPRLLAEFPHLGDFSALGDFEPAYYHKGDSGMDQLLKSQIKRLAIEINANLEQDHTTKKTTNGNPVKTVSKHKWTRQEKIGIASLGVAILGIVLAITIPYYQQPVLEITHFPEENISTLDSSGLFELPAAALSPNLSLNNEVFLTEISNQKFVASSSQPITLKVKIQFSTGANPNQITQAFFLPSWSSTWPPQKGDYFKLEDSIPLLAPGTENEYVLRFNAPEKSGEYYLWLGMGSFYNIDDAVNAFKIKPSKPAHIKFIVKDL